MIEEGHVSLYYNRFWQNYLFFLPCFYILFRHYHGKARKLQKLVNLGKLGQIHIETKTYQKNVQP